MYMYVQCIRIIPIQLILVLVIGIDTGLKILSLPEGEGERGGHRGSFA